tara:strand:- start:7862 stop:9073 length:1212 start_codon:yes stop_codon:yes gene_type:complete
MIKKDIITSSLTNLVGLVLGFLQGVVIARHFGSEGKGEIAFYLSLFTLVFSISNLGIKQSASYYINKNKVSYKNLKFLFLATTLLSAIILFGSFIIQNINIDGYFLILLFTMPFALYVSIFSSIPLSKRDINKINSLRILNSVSNFLLITVFFLILGFTDFRLFFIIHLISYIINSIYVKIYILNKYESNFFFNDKFNFKEALTILKKGFAYCFPLFIYGINYKIDLLILPNYVSNKELGVYALGVGFAEMIWQIPSVLSLVIFSYSVSNKNSLKFSLKIWNNTKKIMLLLIPILILFWTLLYYFIPSVYGEQFDGSSYISLLLIPGTYFIIAFNILNADMAGKGFPLKGLYVFSLGAIINILLNLLLIPKHGIIGSALASSTSYILSAISFVLIYYKQMLKK